VERSEDSLTSPLVSPAFRRAQSPESRAPARDIFEAAPPSYPNPRRFLDLAALSDTCANNQMSLTELTHVDRLEALNRLQAFFRSDRVLSATLLFDQIEQAKNVASLNSAKARAGIDPISRAGLYPPPTGGQIELETDAPSLQTDEHSLAPAFASGSPTIAEQRRLEASEGVLVGLIQKIFQHSDSRMAFSKLAETLAEVVLQAKYPPAPMTRVLHALPLAHLIEKMKAVLVSAIARWVARCVVLRPAILPPLGLRLEEYSGRPADSDWHTIIARGLEQHAADPHFWQGLLGDDVSARNQIFEAISQSAHGWLNEARPRLVFPNTVSAVNALLEIANRGRLRQAPYSRPELILLLTDRLWGFMQAPRYGLSEVFGVLNPAEEHPNAFIQRALLHPFNGSAPAQKGLSVLDSAARGLSSHDAMATRGVVLDLVEHAKRDPACFISEFITDIGDAGEEMLNNQARVSSTFASVG
jgi:hypothetical protein